MNFPPKSTLQKKRLAVAVNAALCLLAPPIAVISETAQAQPPVNISISDDNSFIFLSESEFPVGGDLIIEETGSADAIDHTSFDGTSVWNVTINGIIRGYVYGGIDDDYDSIKLENGSSVTVGATGQASPIELWDGGTVINNGLIEGLTFGGAYGSSAIVSNSGRDGIGTGESLFVENNGTIRVFRDIAIGTGDLIA